MNGKNLQTYVCLYGFMYTHPGSKIIVSRMLNLDRQVLNGIFNGSLDWHLLEFRRAQRGTKFGKRSKYLIQRGTRFASKDNSHLKVLNGSTTVIMRTLVLVLS